MALYKIVHSILRTDVIHFRGVGLSCGGHLVSPWDASRFLENVQNTVERWATQLRTWYPCSWGRWCSITEPVNKYLPQQAGILRLGWRRGGDGTWYGTCARRPCFVGSDSSRYLLVQRARVNSLWPWTQFESPLSGILTCIRLCSLCRFTMSFQLAENEIFSVWLRMPF